MKLKYIVAMTAVCLLSFACKKNNSSTEVSKYFDGKLSFKLHAFVYPGEIYYLTPEGRYSTDGTDFGYFWTVNPTATQRDTVRHAGDPDTYDGTYRFVVPDTLCQLTVTCAIYASGYYNSTHAETPVVVSAASLTGNEISLVSGGIFRDTRSEIDYIYNKIGSTDWMCTNLQWDEVGISYHDCEVMDELFGRLYDWEAAQIACPEGWRLPTVEDWKAICDGDFTGAAGRLMVDAYFNEEKMWDYWPKVKITNETLISALPVGYATVSDDDVSFIGAGNYATFWTSEESSLDSGQGIYVYLNDETPDVMSASADKSHFAASVRCIR